MINYSLWVSVGLRRACWRWPQNYKDRNHFFELVDVKSYYVFEKLYIANHEYKMWNPIYYPSNRLIPNTLVQFLLFCGSSKWLVWFDFHTNFEFQV